MNDPCWRAFALRGLGLVARENGDRRAAQALLSDAVATAGSVPDVYAWCEAVALTDLVELEAGADEGRRLRADGIVRKAPMQDLLRRISAFQTPVQTGGS